MRLLRGARRSRRGEEEGEEGGDCSGGGGGGGDEDEVVLELYSFSRPANVLGGLALPYVRLLQGRFFRELARSMLDQCAGTAG